MNWGVIVKLILNVYALILRGKDEVWYRESINFCLVFLFHFLGMFQDDFYVYTCIYLLIIFKF